VPLCEYQNQKLGARNLSITQNAFGQKYKEIDFVISTLLEDAVTNNIPSGPAKGKYLVL
jgi:hypothetical protein